MNKPLVSIIIPFFNKVDLLIEMVDCIRTQTYEKWELFLVDDGSTDETINSIYKHIKNDERIYLLKRNRSPKNGDTCRNIGYRHANGKYVMFFDADDLISKTCIESRVIYMEANEDCDYASFPYKTFYDGTSLDDTLSNRKNKLLSNKVLLKKLLKNDYPFTVWANIYRRESLYLIQWDENVYVYQDFDFMIQCVLNGLKFKYANVLECDYFYRLFNNGKNVSGNFTDSKKCDSTLYLFDKIYNQLGSFPDSHYYREVFKEYFIIHLYRLLLSNNDKEIQKFIKLSESCYGTIFSKKLNKVYNKWKKKQHLVELYFIMAIEFGNKRFLNYGIHSLAKQLLKKQVMPYK